MNRAENEVYRLYTFRAWPEESTVSPLLLAKWGFSYSGKNDEVVCFACKTQLKGWSSGDNPYDRHKSSSPDCPFMKGDVMANVPLKIISPNGNYAIHTTTTENTELNVDREGVNTALEPLTKLYHTSFDRARRKGLFTVFSSESDFQMDRSLSDFDKLRHEEERLRTFRDWPVTAHVNPVALARNGFFYTGSEDRVQCVFCRGFIHTWLSTDLPEVEHKKQYPDCLFVRGMEVGNVPKLGEISVSSDLRTETESATQMLNEMAQTLTREETRTPGQAYQIQTLDTSTIRGSLDLGYPSDLVKMAIENRLSTAGHNSVTSVSTVPSSQSFIPRHQSDAASLISLRSDASTETTTSIESMSPASAAFTVKTGNELVAEGQSKAKGKRKRYKKKEKTLYAATEDDDQTAETPATSKNDQEKVMGDVNFEDITAKEAIKCMEENRLLREARTRKLQDLEQEQQFAAGNAKKNKEGDFKNIQQELTEVRKQRVEAISAKEKMEADFRNMQQELEEARKQRVEAISATEKMEADFRNMQQEFEEARKQRVEAINAKEKMEADFRNMQQEFEEERKQRVADVNAKKQMEADFENMKQQMEATNIIKDDALEQVKKLQIQPLTTPTPTDVKYPEYVELTKRIQSFKKGVVSRGQTAECLADAGCFHIGPGDKVYCFQCGGNLKDWEPEDDPWEEHRKWYPECAYTRTHTPSSRTQSQQALQVGAVYRPEPREVKARMDTPTVRAILEMGYPRDLVRIAIENRLSTAGDDFPNAESLLEAVLLLEETGTQSKAPAVAAASNYATETVSMTSDTAVSFQSMVPASQEKQTASAAVAVTTRNELVAEGQAKAKGKRKRNKKKTLAASFGDDDQSVEMPVLAKNDQERVEEDNNAGDANLDDVLDEEAMKYYEENRQLREARTCKVCMDKEVNTVFLPCGHLVCCSDCSPQLRNCPICRTFIRGTVKTFLS